MLSNETAAATGGSNVLESKEAPQRLRERARNHEGICERRLERDGRCRLWRLGSVRATASATRPERNAKGDSLYQTDRKTASLWRPPQSAPSTELPAVWFGSQFGGRGDVQSW